MTIASVLVSLITTLPESVSHSLICTQIFVSLPSLEHKLYADTDFCLSCLLLCSQCLEDCLEYGRCSVHVNCRKDWMRDGYPQSGQVGFLSPSEGPSPFTTIISRLSTVQGTWWGLLGRREGMEATLCPYPAPHWEVCGLGTQTCLPVCLQSHPPCA